MSDVPSRADGRKEPKERKPLSCEISGHAWPPKFTTGVVVPRAPVPTPVPREPEPLSPPTIENRVAALAAILVAVLYFITCLSKPVILIVTLPLFGYFGLLAVGAWRVRPRPRRGHVFFFWFLPILLQLSVYLLLTWRLSPDTYLAGDPFASRDLLVMPLLIASAVLFFTAWIPAIFLSSYCQRGGWLLAAEALAPLVVPFWFGLVGNLVL